MCRWLWSALHPPPQIGEQHQSNREENNMPEVSPTFLAVQNDQESVLVRRESESVSERGSQRNIQWGGSMLWRKEAGEMQRPGGPAKKVQTQGPVTRLERPPSGIFTEDPQGSEQGSEWLENRLLQGTRLGAPSSAPVWLAPLGLDDAQPVMLWRDCLRSLQNLVFEGDRGIHSHQIVTRSLM